MLAGRPPFGGESAVEIALRHVQTSSRRPLPPGTPDALSAIIARALAKDPADRYQSAVAMADALARARESAGWDQIDAPAPSDEWWETPTQVPDATTEIFAADTRTLPLDGVDPTRPAPRMTPRRTVNPAARRRTVAVFVLALAVLGAMLVAARALTAAPTVSVPRLHGLTAREVTAQAPRAAPPRPCSPTTTTARGPEPRSRRRRPRARRVKQDSTVSVAHQQGARRRSTCRR